MVKDSFELDELERHVFLYAKGFYSRSKDKDGKTDDIHRIEDLRELIAKVRGVYKRNMSVNRVGGILIGVCARIGVNIEPDRLITFLKDLFGPDVVIDAHSEKRFDTSVMSLQSSISRMVDFISRIQIEGREDGLIIYIGEPDEKILPVAKK